MAFEDRTPSAVSPPDVSVVVSTYNRSSILLPALQSIVGQEAGGVGYELIVVDNNSTDGTRELVEEFIAGCGFPHVRYVFEGRQGLSHGRNAGIAAARAPIVAFTDDDVRVPPDWVASIAAAFRAWPEAGYVGGKVLPLWEAEPPAWLRSRQQWAPLALTDCGPEPFGIGIGKPVCMVGANLAFRR
jgi:glucosyl-dolichyl phosphate glucuronosyltransferase